MYEYQVKPLLPSLFQKGVVTLFAYGQTGSGKTFSMEGAKDDSGQYVSRGLIPRIFEHVFELFSNDSEVTSYEVSIQYMEVRRLF